MAGRRSGGALRRRGDGRASPRRGSRRSRGGRRRPPPGDRKPGGPASGGGGRPDHRQLRRHFPGPQARTAGHRPRRGRRPRALPRQGRGAEPGLRRRGHARRHGELRARRRLVRAMLPALSRQRGAPMPEIRFTHRLRYAFDNSMSKGAIALIGYLALASLTLIMVAGLVVILFGIRPGDAGQPPGFVEAMWLSLMRTLDSGTMGGDEGTGFRLIMLFVTLGGIFIVSSLIGVINNGIEGKLDELRKGRSFVIERDHTLILGWSPKIFTILSELVLANENRHKPRVVVLADRDKVEMEDEIEEKVGDTGKTRIICRTGSSLDLNDLEIEGAAGAAD